MPLDAARYRDTLGHNEHHLSYYVSPVRQQHRLNRVAAMQEQRLPNRCNVVSTLFLSSLILPNIQTIGTTSQAPPLTPTRANPPIRLPQLPDAIASVGATTSSSIRVTPRSPHAMPANVPPSTPHFSVVKRGNADKQAAAADAPKIKMEYLQRDEKNNLLIAESDEGKKLLLRFAKTFLADLEGATPSQLAALEFTWLQAATAGPIILSRLDGNQPFQRDKRISLSGQDKKIQEHIGEHCAIETEIYNSEGLSEGKLLLLKAQRIDNPFRMLYDDIDGFTPPKALEFGSTLFNFLINIISLGIKPVITSPIANFYRRQYYQGLGDDICATRQNHISFAQVATSLEVGGLSYPRFSKNKRIIPTELQNTRIVPEKATYTSHNKHSNTKNSLSLLSKRKNHDEQEVLLKSKGANEFETYSLDPTNKKWLKRKVIFVQEKNIWRYADGDDITPLDIRIEVGETFISLLGKHFPLRINKNKQYDIITQSRFGVKKYRPVYQEPLSKTWHLKAINGHDVFTPTQLSYIDKIKIKLEPHFKYTAIDNQLSELYGNGRLFEVRNLQDDLATTLPLYTVVEMNGCLVPVKMTIKPNYGVRYRIYDVNSHSQQEYRIAWDGERWSIENTSSPHVSSTLSQRITTEMYAQDLDDDLLSAPDRQGIKWLNNQGYLNIRGGYVEIHKGKLTQLGPANGKQISVYYFRQQFEPYMPDSPLALWRKRVTEHFYERLKDASKEFLQNGIQAFQIEKAAKMTFVSSPLPPPVERPLPKGPIDVQVKPVSSTTLGRKRFLVTLNDDDYFFVEISLDGNNVWVLIGDESDQAMEKYQRNLAGGDIVHAVTLKRNIDPLLIRPSSRTKLDNIAFKRIETGAGLISDTLKSLTLRGTQGNILLLGHADFFMTSAFENNVFSSPENAYQALIDTFIPLSKKYPNVVIVPGSLFISQNIPEHMRRRGLQYREGNRVRALDDAINFSTVLVPVLYKGKFVTIARKGEYLSYRPQGALPEEPSVDIGNLDTVLPSGTRLTINNAKINPFEDHSEWQDAHTGTIYSGKTLIPGEKILAEWFFGPRYDSNGTVMDIEHFFSSEFMIGDNKFLIVIEDEFVQQQASRPKVRTLAFPFEEKLNETNRYDWIIHPGSVVELDDMMRSASFNYLLADRASSGQFISDVNTRTKVITHEQNNQLTIFEFNNES